MHLVKDALKCESKVIKKNDTNVLVIKKHKHTAMYNMASKYCICIIVVCFESRLGKVLRSKCDTKGNT